MSIRDGRLILDDGRVLAGPPVADFQRDGDHIQFRVPFDSQREQLVRTSARTLTSTEFTIWRKPGEICSLDASQHVLSLPRGLINARTPIAAVVQIGDRFIVHYRDPQLHGAIDCVTRDGTVLWRFPHKVALVFAQPESDEFTAVNFMTYRVSGITGEIVMQRVTY